jgi:predicted TIM-barrel enzyme
MQRLRLSLIAFAVLLIGSLALTAGSFAQTIDREKIARFVSFRSFLTSTRAAKFETYQRLAGTRVADAKAFEEMRSYILNYYEGVVVVSTFATDGAFADCVTIESSQACVDWA